jgi:hypothetical protein
VCYSIYRRWLFQVNNSSNRKGGDVMYITTKFRIRRTTPLMLRRVVKKPLNVLATSKTGINTTTVAGLTPVYTQQIKQWDYADDPTRYDQD